MSNDYDQSSTRHISNHTHMNKQLYKECKLHNVKRMKARDQTTSDTMMFFPWWSETCRFPIIHVEVSSTLGPAPTREATLPRKSNHLDSFNRTTASK